MTLGAVRLLRSNLNKYYKMIGEFTMIELAEIKKEDIPRCVEIYIAAFGYDEILTKIDNIAVSDTELSGSLKKHYDFEAYFSKCMEYDDKYALCLKDDGKTVGFITAWDMLSVESENAIYIDAIAVAPECQKKGYGTIIIEEFIRAVSKEKLVVLNTEKNLPAYALYKKLGFVETEMIVMQKSPKIDKVKAELEKQKAELKEIMAREGKLEEMQKILEKCGINL